MDTNRSFWTQIVTILPKYGQISLILDTFHHIFPYIPPNMGILGSILAQFAYIPTPGTIFTHFLSIFWLNLHIYPPQGPFLPTFCPFLAPKSQIWGNTPHFGRKTHIFHDFVAFSSHFTTFSSYFSNISLKFYPKLPKYHHHHHSRSSSSFSPFEKAYLNQIISSTSNPTQR